MEIWYYQVSIYNQNIVWNFQTDLKNALGIEGKTLFPGIIDIYIRISDTILS